MTLANWIHPLLFRGGAEWSPLDMEHLEIWLDASQIAGLADGDPLAIWPDMSGKGNAALQGVGANQPTYLVGIQNGLPVIRFDGATDHLTCGDLETFYSNVAGRGLSVFTVCQHPLWVRKALCGKYNAGLGQRMFSFESSINYFQENAGGYNPNTNADVTDDAAWRIVSFSWEPGGKMITCINGFQDHIANAVLNDLSDVTVDLLIGWGDPNAGTWNGDFAAQLFFSDSIVGDNMATLVAFLMSKWGVVDPYAGYKLYDTFTDINGTNLNVHVPEKGAWTEVDTGGLCDIQSNKAQITGAGIYTDPLFYAGPFDRITGAEFVFTIKPGQLNQQMAIALWDGLNFDPATGDKEHLMWFFSDGNIYCREAVEPAAVAYTTDEVECKIVLKAVGAEYWYNGVKVADLAVNSGGPLYVGVAAKGGTWDFDFMSYNIPA